MMHALKRFTPALILAAVLAWKTAPQALAQQQQITGFSFSVVDSNGNASLISSGAAINFPRTALEGSSPLSLVITYRGTEPSTINSITVTGDAFQASGIPLPNTVVSGNSDTRIGIRFVPTQLGPNSGVVTVRVPTNTYTFLLAGTGTGARITYTIDQGSGVNPFTPQQTATFPVTAVGERSLVTLQILNAGNADGRISELAVSGAAFQLADQPFLPVVVAPNAQVAFKVAFAPTQFGDFSGQLKIGADTFFLRATAIGPSLGYAYVTPGGTVPVQTGSTVAFPAAAVSGSSKVDFSITNNGTAPAVVSTIALDVSSNKSFQLSNVPGLPLTLRPGESGVFTATFAPTALGPATASLRIEALSFPALTLPLTGIGAAPPAIPRYSFEGATLQQEPLSQPSIGLTLAEPYNVPISGNIALNFDSAVFANDPAIQFSNGSRSAAFTIPAGSTRATFANGATQIQLSTGSVAGAITVTPSFANPDGLNLTPDSPTILRMTVAQSAPRLLNAQVETKTATGFTLVLTGLATGRNLTGITTKFTLAPGVTLTVPDITQNVEPAFTLWYQAGSSQQFGSLFTVSLPFTLQGQVQGFANLVDAIQSVSVTLTNREGTSTARTVALR